MPLLYSPPRFWLRQPRAVQAPAIVVGIGYPTDDFDESRRWRFFFDLTPPVYKGPPEALLPDVTKTGWGEIFLRVIEEEVKPFLAARYKVDRTKQTLLGYSPSGLLTLHVLSRNPGASAFE
jgi:predicted alpha/beta superfamily hydrolase